MRILAIAAVAVPILLSSCSMLSSPRTLPPLPLLPPAELEKRVQLSQRVTVRLEEQTQTFLGAWAVDSERLSFVGLTPSGQRLLSLSYDGRSFSEDYSAMLDDPVPGRDILSHLQLAHWPAASIDRKLKATDWRVEYAGGERHLYFKGNLILTIAAHYTKGKYAELPAAIRITSHVAPYGLEVETLQVIEK